MSPLKHHPRVLPFLFLTEMWERFGFYIVQGLLVLYMTQYFGFSDSKSYTIMGVFTALAYISPLIGGYLATAVLGYRIAILWGGIFLVLGYILLSLPYAETLLYPALATIVIGNGLLKPNISSLLGTQYHENDPRRDSGYTIFYVGINIGALFSGLSGYIKELFGWKVSFALAGIGLIIGLFTFTYGLKYLTGNVDARVREKKHLHFRVLLGCCLSIAAVTFLLKIDALADYLLPFSGLILLIGLIVVTLQQEKSIRNRMILLNILIVSSIVFWMLMLQIFYSGNLFVDRLVDREFFGFHLPTTAFYPAESFFIILLGPFFAWGWQTLTKHNINISVLNKFILGILFAGLGFLVLAIGTYFPNMEGLINPFWVYFSYLLITIGELLLSPIGLSAVTQLAPAHWVSVMMGIWFVALGFGGIFAGWIAQLADVPQNVESMAEKLFIYQSAFFDYAYIAFFVVIVLFLIQLSLRKYLNIQ